jgi:hypothetical protein
MSKIKEFLETLSPPHQQLVRSVLDDIAAEYRQGLVRKLTKRIGELTSDIERNRKRALNHDAQVRDTDLVNSELRTFMENGAEGDLPLMMLGELLRDRSERLSNLAERNRVMAAEHSQRIREWEETLARLKNRMQIAESLGGLFEDK